MPRTVPLNKTDKALLSGSRHSKEGKHIKQRRKTYGVTADDKYQEDTEQCTRGWRGMGMLGMGAVLQEWSRKASLGKLTS